MKPCNDITKLALIYKKIKESNVSPPKPIYKTSYIFVWEHTKSYCPICDKKLKECVVEENLEFKKILFCCPCGYKYALEQLTMIENISKTIENVSKTMKNINRELFYDTYKSATVARVGHPNKRDDHIETVYVDNKGNLISLDKKPTQEMIAIAPFSGQGSSKHPICPFCGEKSKCKEHYIGDILNRADSFTSIVYDITGGIVCPEFRNDKTFANYGILSSGNLTFSKNPKETISLILNDLLKQTIGRCTNNMNNEISEFYNKCLDLSLGFTYTSKYRRIRITIDKEC